jgi:hypothetical protein
LRFLDASKHLIPRGCIFLGMGNQSSRWPFVRDLQRSARRPSVDFVMVCTYNLSFHDAVEFCDDHTRALVSDYCDEKLFAAGPQKPCPLIWTCSSCLFGSTLNGGQLADEYHQEFLCYLQ